MIAGAYLGWQQLPGGGRGAAQRVQGVLDSINGRYLALRDYLDYQHGGAYAVRLGSGECDDGFCGMTNGRDWYRWLLKKHTTTDMTPEQVHALGLSEVERIFGAMVRCAIPSASVTATTWSRASRAARSTPSSAI